MVKRSIILLLIISVLSLFLLTACNGQTSDSTNDEAKQTETTVVLETLADGGTVEQDSEGNTIEKNSEGKVVSVTDKNGNTVSVTEYLVTHSWVEDSAGNSGSSVDPDNKGIKTDEPSSSNSGKAGSSSSQKENKNSSSTTDDEEAEEEIPVVIATMPDDDDTEKLPDF